MIGKEMTMFPYKTVLWIALLLVAGFYLLPHSVPIIAALLTAIVLEPLVKSLQKSLNLRRTASVVLTFVCFLLIIGGLIYFVITRMVIEIVELSQWLPQLIGNLSHPVQNWFSAMQHLYEQMPPEYVTRIEETTSNLFKSLNSLTSDLLNGLITVIKSLPNLLMVLVVYVIALFLFLLDLPSLVRRFLNLFDDTTQVKVKIILNNLNRAIIGFLQAQILISFLTYDLVLIGLWILGVKYALAVALIIVLVDILPVLGTGAVMIPWIAYAFLKNNESLGIGLLILYLLIMVFRRIIEPKILGNSLGISALATLISMYLGFMVLGFLGMLLGPALVILFQAFREAGFFQFRIRL
ncbi:MAG: sporulation integral membrane protein YtvI [Tumebacillaceae bacterium]